MKIQLQANKIALTEEIKNYVQTKVDMLDKYLGNLVATNCDVDLSLDSNSHQKGEMYKVEINLVVPGQLLHVEKVEDQLLKAVDKAKDHMAEVIKEHKGKLIDKHRN
ncbi:MAG: ribosome-associated translation inhibitor RaiA [Planctomycetes bacterium]|jgi:ribosomal subunit interface protein|nr:ribosome-associated translation inhibitor RaiA [Planctomycetota bacterium]